MLSQPADRTQVDGLQEVYSDAGALDCSDKPDLTRQEFKKDADINVILSRFNINDLQRPLSFGEVDYDIDLQRGIAALKAAKEAFDNLDPRIKQNYQTWQEFVTAVETGQFTLDNQPEKSDTTPPATPPA